MSVFMGFYFSVYWPICPPTQIPDITGTKLAQIWAPDWPEKVFSTPPPPPPPTWHFLCGNAKMGRRVNSPDLTGTAAATDINGQPLLLSKIDSLACYCFC